LAPVKATREVGAAVGVAAEQARLNVPDCVVPPPEAETVLVPHCNVTLLGSPRMPDVWEVT
jgi:hypothetical protein